MRLRFATTSGVGGATGAGAAGGGEDDDVLTALSVDEGDDDILACTPFGEGTAVVELWLRRRRPGGKTNSQAPHTCPRNPRSHTVHACEMHAL